MPPGGGPGGPMGFGRGDKFLSEEEKANQPKVTPALLRRVFSYLKPYTGKLVLVLVCIHTATRPWCVATVMSPFRVRPR